MIGRLTMAGDESVWLSEWSAFRSETCSLSVAFQGLNCKVHNSCTYDEDGSLVKPRSLHFYHIAIPNITSISILASDDSETVYVLVDHMNVFSYTAWSLYGPVAMARWWSLIGQVPTKCQKYLRWNRSTAVAAGCIIVHDAAAAAAACCSIDLNAPVFTVFSQQGVQYSLISLHYCKACREFFLNSDSVTVYRSADDEGPQSHSKQLLHNCTRT